MQKTRPSQSPFGIVSLPYQLSTNRASPPAALYPLRRRQGRQTLVKAVAEATADSQVEPQPLQEVGVLTDLLLAYSIIPTFAVY